MVIVIVELSRHAWNIEIICDFYKIKVSLEGRLGTEVLSNFALNSEVSFKLFTSLVAAAECNQLNGLN